MGVLSNLLSDLKTKTINQLVSIVDALYPGDPDATSANNAYFTANVHPYLQALGIAVRTKNTLYVKSDAPDDFNGSDNMIFQTAQGALDSIPTTGSAKPTISNPWIIIGDPTIDFSGLIWTAHIGAGTALYIKIISNSQYQALTFRMLLTQTETAAPTVQSLSENLYLLTFTRIAIGRYNIASAALFTLQRTRIFDVLGIASATGSATFSQIDASNIEIDTFDASGNAADGILSNNLFEINVW